MGEQGISTPARHQTEHMHSETEGQQLVLSGTGLSLRLVSSLCILSLSLSVCACVCVCVCETVCVVSTWTDLRLCLFVAGFSGAAARPTEGS
mmetsp:Transcript_36700/g.91930  ORF Transcript_36700/g.91930 Transcript_36700/m.91930 type:complete len:92 (-) Transcript_36700:134-409(-)